MSGPAELIEIGRAHMATAHELILVGAALGVLSILAGIASRKLGTPILLVFLVLGMLAGEDGPGGIPYNDFYSAYLIGSVALALILFHGGGTTPVKMLRLAFWPALALAVVGVAITAVIVGGAVALFAPGIPVPAAMLVGAAIAPTDAAAVIALLQRARLKLPERLTALLEVESGLNDPMSVFLTILLILLLVQPQSLDIGSGGLLFLREMAGGAIIGLVGGGALKFLLQRLTLEPAMAMVLVGTGGLVVFGFAQVLGTSGFLGVYLAGVVVGMSPHRAQQEVRHFLEGLAWLAQIVLFLMLGLLVTPHKLAPVLPIMLGVAAVLFLLARPVAVFACLLPFRFTLRESTFAAWVGLRGAVPIYLSIIPALADPARDSRLFEAVFVLVVVSLIVQGWTIGLAGRLLGYAPAE
jgi:NhaP-type Na+/H+ and K+/H+ antiporter